MLNLQVTALTVHISGDGPYLVGEAVLVLLAHTYVGRYYTNNNVSFASHQTCFTCVSLAATHRSSNLHTRAGLLLNRYDGHRRQSYDRLIDYRYKLMSRGVKNAF